MAVSILVHVLALATLGLVPGVLRMPVSTPDRPARIVLLPKPARRRPLTPRSSQTPPAVTRAPMLPVRLHQTPAPQRPAPAPLLLPPAPPAEVAAGPPAIRFYDVHVPGCGREDLVLMSPSERFACEGRIAAARGDGGRAWIRPGAPATPSFIPDDKRGAYAVEAAANERRRRRYDPDVPMGAPIVACSGAGSNFGLGCVPDTSMITVARH